MSSQRHRPPLLWVFRDMGIFLKAVDMLNEHPPQALSTPGSSTVFESKCDGQMLLFERDALEHAAEQKHLKSGSSSESRGL